MMEHPVCCLEVLLDGTATKGGVTGNAYIANSDGNFLTLRSTTFTGHCVVDISGLGVQF